MHNSIPSRLCPLGVCSRIDSKVSYIEAHDGQYIDTLVPVTTNTIIEAKWYQVDNSIQQRLFGINEGGSMQFALYINNNTQWAINTGTTGNTTGLNVAKNTEYQCSMNLGTGVCVINHITKNNDGTPFSTENTIPIFQRKNAGTVQTTYPAAMRLYWFKIWQGSNLVMDGIPVRVSDVGYLYDRTRNIMLGNSGTGSFQIGQDVN